MSLPLLPGLRQPVPRTHRTPTPVVEREDPCIAYAYTYGWRGQHFRDASRKFIAYTYRAYAYRGYTYTHT